MVEERNRHPPERFILLGDHQIQLPEGLTHADWQLEKIRWQNPRIRAFLGCIRLLDEVLESNYAILHCSPERLHEIWRKVREVGELMRTKMAPLLDQPSRFSALEEARQRAELSFKLLSKSVLSDLERYASEVPSKHLIEVRKLLCVSIGKLHAFLQDTLGELMASDPRSSHNADYFLSKRFPRDLEEAEWLHATVERLLGFLVRLEEDRVDRFQPLVERLGREPTLPVGETWAVAAAFIERLIDSLTPKLKEVLALRGIRFYEMEILDRYAVEIPTQCRVLLELHHTGRRTVDELKATASSAASRAARERVVHDLETCHRIFCRRLSELMGEIDTKLKDLVAFVPIWLDGITKRRALLLRGPQNGDGA